MSVFLWFNGKHLATKRVKIKEKRWMKKTNLQNLKKFSNNKYEVVVIGSYLIKTQHEIRNGRTFPTEYLHFPLSLITSIEIFIWGWDPSVIIYLNQPNEPKQHRKKQNVNVTTINAKQLDPCFLLHNTMNLSVPFSSISFSTRKNKREEEKSRKTHINNACTRWFISHKIKSKR